MNKDIVIKNINNAIRIIDVLELSLNAYDKRNRMAVELLKETLKELKDKR